MNKCVGLAYASGLMTWADKAKKNGVNDCGHCSPSRYEPKYSQDHPLLYLAK